LTIILFEQRRRTMPPRYTEEFKIEAVKQVTEHNYPVAEAAIRLGVHPDSLRTWIKRYQTPQSINEYAHAQSNNAEICRLRAELKRVTEECDILKKAATYFQGNFSLHETAFASFARSQG